MKINSMLRLGNGLLKYYLFNQRTPLTVSYLSTFTCDQKCEYCDWTKLNLQEMTTEQSMKMIQGLRRSGVIKLGFAGGESLNRRDIDLLLECSHKSGLITSISSNGRAIQEHLDAINKFVDVVQLSLDGRQRIHDELRGKGSFNNVMTSIELLKSHNKKVITNTVITKKNISELPYILSIADKFRHKALFQPVFKYNLSESDDVITKLQPAHYEMLLAIDYLLKQKKHMKCIGNSVAFFKYIQNTWSNPQIIKCHANDLFCTVDPMGYILPCCFDMQQNKECNVAEMGFKQAFSNSKKNKFAKQCEGCYCNAYIESNLAFSFHLTACVNALSII